MATSTAIASIPPPQQIAKGLAGAVPAELSKSPLLGILGVIMGAGIVSLMGRMVTLGLADLKGDLGIGLDDGAWTAAAWSKICFPEARLWPARGLSANQDLGYFVVITSHFLGLQLSPFISLQLGILFLSWFEDREVRVGIFP